MTDLGVQREESQTPHSKEFLMPDMRTQRRPARGRRAAVAVAAGLTVAGVLAGVAVAAVANAPATVSAGKPAAGKPAAGEPAVGKPAAAQPRMPRPGGVTRGVTRRGQAMLAASNGHRPLRTSCRSVAHIGDSTSVDLISPADLPNPAQRLAARYTQVGVRHLRIDASGGRSIVEVMPGQVNGYNVAKAWWDSGYRGCWVFALGTNDTANVAVGSSVGIAARINQMMSVVHGEPVMWVNTRTLLSTGPWAEANERAWDRALVQALHRYPNMRVFDWAAVARPSWFLFDGIHYNSLGCAERAKAIADALARAFPVGSRGQRASADRVVR